MARSTSLEKHFSEQLAPAKKAAKKKRSR